MTASGGKPLDWRYFQVFGEELPEGTGLEGIQEVDLLSALDFDETGDYLATGDRGGRVVVFERGAVDKANEASPDVRPNPVPLRAQQDAQYFFLAEFQSHEPSFDYLKSLEIDEKINSIRWCRGSMGCKMLLSTNDKTIKLWKIYDKEIKVLSNMNMGHSNGATLSSGISARPWRAGKGLRLPRVSTRERVMTATPKRVFSNAHAYHINSIALNSDGESFMSCDDLRLNLWNLNNNLSCSNIVDIKPANMDALSEVITSADFHPTDCHTFLYSSSRGCVHLGDMRAAALCDHSMKSFTGPGDPATINSRFFEIVSAISNARFSRDGRYIVTRDYLNVRIWDVNMESGPVRTFNVHGSQGPSLEALYSNDLLFDKFEARFNHDGTQVMTGSYHNKLNLFSTDGSQPNQVLEASRRPHLQAVPQTRLHNGILPPDFSRRILHASFHPRQNLVAIAATSALYIMNAA